MPEPAAGWAERLPRPQSQAVREEIGPMIDTADPIRREDDAGTTPVQIDVLRRVLMHAYHCTFAEMVGGWAARSRARIDSRPAQAEAERRAAAPEVYRRLPVAPAGWPVPTDGPWRSRSGSGRAGAGAPPGADASAAAAPASNPAAGYDSRKTLGSAVPAGYLLGEFDQIERPDRR